MATATDDNDAQIEEIKDETEKVFRNFVYRRLISQVDKVASEGDLDLASFRPSVLNDLRGAQQEIEKDNENAQQAKINKLGKALAMHGDDIEPYHDNFQEMLSQLDLSEENIIPSFTKFARELFKDGISWGQIISLLWFGYEIAFSVIRRGVCDFESFLQKLVSLVVKFIVNEKIAKWIAAQGGWAELLRFSALSVEDENMKLNFTIGSFAMTSILIGAYLVHKFANSGK